MIKVSVMYLNKFGVCFNYEYYCDIYMLLVKVCMGDICCFYMVDKGLVGGVLDMLVIYVGMCYIFCDLVEFFQVGFGLYVVEIMGDILNYIDLQLIVQISEVVVGNV